MRLFRTPTYCWLQALILLSCSAVAASADDVVFARHLALSPDGQTLAFSWAGDIWTVPISGGRAMRLTAHSAHDSRPVWSPDGQQLAFSSDRHGSPDVYVMERDGTGLRRLTYSDQGEAPSAWSPDGAWVYFHGAREADATWETRVYRVPATGGQAWRAMDCLGREASVSPDGTQIAFTRGSATWGRRGYRGSANYDIYIQTGPDQFTQLTDLDSNERDPAWDATGTGVYYLSDRGGPVNVWYQPVAGGEAEQVTRMTGDDVRDYALSADGKTLAFTHWDEIYVLAVADRLAQAIKVTVPDDTVRNDEQFRTFTDDADEFQESPDGDEVALVVHGEIFVVKADGKKPTRRVTDCPARDRDVTWSPDGKALFFVSDREGQEDIYRAISAEDPPQPLADSLRFKVERVSDDPALEYAPAVSPDGKRLAYLRERGDLIIRDLEHGTESKLLASWNAPRYHWSPDSKWIAYEVEDIEHNPDVWVVPADGSKPPVNISQHPDYDGDPQWSADGQMLAFSSERHGFDSDLYVVFLSPQRDELSGAELDEYFEKQAEAVKKCKPPKSVVASGKIVLAGEVPATQPAESQPAESQPVEAPVAASQPAEVPAVTSQVAETQPAATEPVATQPAPVEEPLPLRTRIGNLLRFFLEEPKEEPPAAEAADKPKEKGKGKDKGKDEEAKEDKKKDEPKFEYELETCYRRVRRVTSLDGNQTAFSYSPDGQLLAFTSGHEGGPKLYTVKWNGSDLKRIVNAGVHGMRWTLDGKRLFYLRGGVPNSCTASGGGAEAHRFRAKMTVRYSAEAGQKFEDAARQLGLRFYHPTMKGLDWAALTRKYRDLALQTRTLFEFNQIFTLLLGELNASHMGIFGGWDEREIAHERLGYLGCTFDATYPGPGLRVASILPRSPADKAGSRLFPGDVLLTVDGQPVGPDRALERALIDAVGDEVIVTYIPSPSRQAAEEAAATTQPAAESEPAATTQPAAEGDAPEASEPVESEPAVADEKAEAAEAPTTQDLVIRPTSSGAIGNLAYDAWVTTNAEYVNRLSDQKVGYLHIPSMNEPSFEVFERDLYAAAHGREGLIIDVRNNGGGWTADWILAVLSVQRHAFTVARGGEPGYPQDRLIFYAWTKPATMMCNEHSFSNAEIVSHAFKTLKRGPLVGMTSHGGVISTGAYRLLDGAVVRMPGRGWYALPDGKDMENNGAEPDVRVAITPADEVHGRRPQLDAAIQATLEQIQQAGTQP